MPWQIQGFLEVRNNQLHINGVNAVELAREHGTPLFVFSEARIRRNIERLRKSASVIDCPLKLCYAAKAMSTMGILRAIKDANCDIEVNSGGELWKALKAGFSGYLTKPINVSRFMTVLDEALGSQRAASGCVER
jgi:diaminopimelate decarboxylase